MADEAVLTFAAEGILKKVLSLAQKEFSVAWGFKADLKKLQDSFTDIEPFLLNVAGQSQGGRKSVEDWVKNLEDVGHDAEDVFDELEYEDCRRKVEIQNHMKKKVLNFFSLSNPLAFRLQMAHKIQNINASLVDLERKASLLGLASMSIGAAPREYIWGRETHSLMGRDEITVGREDDVSKIVGTLTDSKYNQENLAVLAIVGMGGLGKTTLAKSVYNDDSIRKFFEMRIWVVVSSTFDVNLILLQLLEQINPAKASSSKDNHNAILANLREELKDKRYLLVLDDVWNEDSSIWEQLMECLSKLNSARGSKIIVTTRSGKVACISEKLLPRHELGKLSVNQCWSIIKNRAFLNSGAHIAPEFETIGMEIAKNCDGVPLVAKVLGGILHTKRSMEEWLLFKDGRILNFLPKGKDIIMRTLKLSFDNLASASLKQCFAYCSMFEKDFEIERDNLIQLWMAQGLLHPSSGESKDMEDIGNEYFDILLQSSLFQDATMGDNDIVSKCKMQVSVHELAKLVSKSKSLTGDFSVLDTLEIRHVAGVSTSILKKIPERSAGNLLSLVFEDGEVPIDILPRFKALRVLNVSNANFEELPSSIERLKHLRYLDISETRFKTLPNSIGKLYNLQVLRATNCALEEFPKKLQNLINLRHIYFDESTKFPQGIRRLTCLQTLPQFLVSNEIGRQIEELAHLDQLKGELIVCDLEHVKNGEEAKKAKLERKTKVRHFTFRWTRGRPTTNSNKEDVLEGLRPHLELESLSIENFMGDTFPTWMMSRSLLFDNLKKVQLLGCDKCESLPPLGRLPNLTELDIRGISKLECVGAKFYGCDLVSDAAGTSKEMSIFPSLKVLYISQCSDLIQWMEAPMLTQKRVVFPCLKELDIRNCSKLRNAPRHFPFLQKLVIISSDSRTPIEEISSGLTTLTSLEIEGIKELTCLPQEILRNNHNLSSLKISDCDDLTCIAPNVFGSCRFLERLVISKCKELRHLPDGLDALSFLKYLDMYKCSSLESIPITQGMASLRTLYIRGCERLSSLPSGLEYCTSLQKLSIGDCNGVTSFPIHTIASLRQLDISFCEGLSGPLSVCASLVELHIWDCHNMTSIKIKGGVSLTSLQKLIIRYCHELSSLPAPQQFPSLKQLWIWDCPKLPRFGVPNSSVEEMSISLQSDL